MGLNDEMEMKAIVRGRVQGVGFRAKVCHYARNYGIVGTVKNLEDGSVEIIGQGQKKSLDCFLKELKDKPGAGYIDQICIDYFPKRSFFNEFTTLF